MKLVEEKRDTFVIVGMQKAQGRVRRFLKAVEAASVGKPKGCTIELTCPGSGDESIVDAWPFGGDLVEDPRTLAEIIVDRAADDVDSYIQGTGRYVVRALGLRERCAFSLKEADEAARFVLVP